MAREGFSDFGPDGIAMYLLSSIMGQLVLSLGGSSIPGAVGGMILESGSFPPSPIISFITRLILLFPLYSFHSCSIPSYHVSLSGFIKENVAPLHSCPPSFSLLTYPLPPLSSVGQVIEDIGKTKPESVIPTVMIAYAISAIVTGIGFLALGYFKVRLFNAPSPSLTLSLSPYNSYSKRLAWFPHWLLSPSHPCWLHW